MNSPSISQKNALDYSDDDQTPYIQHTGRKSKRDTNKSSYTIPDIRKNSGGDKAFIDRELKDFHSRIHKSNASQNNEIEMNTIQD